MSFNYINNKKNTKLIYLFNYLYNNFLIFIILIYKSF